MYPYLNKQTIASGIPYYKGPSLCILMLSNSTLCSNSQAKLTLCRGKDVMVLSWNYSWQVTHEK